MHGLHGYGAWCAVGGTYARLELIRPAAHPTFARRLFLLVALAREYMVYIHTGWKFSHVLPWDGKRPRRDGKRTGVEREGGAGEGVVVVVVVVLRLLGLILANDYMTETGRRETGV